MGPFTAMPGVTVPNRQFEGKLRYYRVTRHYLTIWPSFNNEDPDKSKACFGLKRGEVFAVVGDWFVYTPSWTDRAHFYARVLSGDRIGYIVDPEDLNWETGFEELKPPS